MDHINRRLSSWKTKTLSFAGRLTLTKSVLAAIPSYTMKTVLLSKQLCDDIDKSCRSFIWGQDSGKRRIHALAWEGLCLWKNCNNFTFCQIVTNPLQVVCEIKGRMHVLSSTTFCKPHIFYQKDNPKSHIRWTPPPSNILKLNCDGVVADNACASCGGILRDNNGDFILAFSGLIGNCSVLQAELWAIFHGLRLIKDKFLSYHIIIESDSVIATEFLNKGCPRIHPCYSLINQIVRMAGEFYEVECVHILQKPIK
uniref:Ribonuclease H protein At1g65750 family n=1 Tax=Cajanus cajan TaxID=3821 RepID=A0A151S1L1_CAJCA|nr:Putative ribonuclease H protein At1g65750 family [Cajanus cajan]